MDFYIVDVFAEEKYQGNQLAVIVPDRPIFDEEMRQIARETNFSETSFIMSDKLENGGYNTRIFTPDGEIPFAGHPTLGTAYVIDYAIEGGNSNKVILNLPVGPIPVDFTGETLTMAQNEPVFGLKVEQTDFAAGALSLKPEDICADYPVQMVSSGLPSFIIPLNSIDAVQRCAVDHAHFKFFLEKFHNCNVLVFAKEKEGGPRLRARVFMNDCGYREDPATGSANGNLAGYLLQYGLFGKNKIEVAVSQGVEMGRPSRLLISAEQTDGKFNIRVGGKVRPVAKGHWL